MVSTKGSDNDILPTPRFWSHRWHLWVEGWHIDWFYVSYEYILFHLHFRSEIYLAPIKSIAWRPYIDVESRKRFHNAMINSSTKTLHYIGVDDVDHQAVNWCCMWILFATSLFRYLATFIVSRKELPKVGRHTAGKWLIQGFKHHKNNQSQSMKCVLH